MIVAYFSDGATGIVQRIMKIVEFLMYSEAEENFQW